jgi:hypothetical protein
MYISEGLQRKTQKETNIGTDRTLNLIPNSVCVWHMEETEELIMKNWLTLAHEKPMICHLYAGAPRKLELYEH